MDLQLTDEQRLILDSARRLIAAEYGFEARRQRVKERITVDPKTWRAFADLGWFGIGVPEELGGYGASAIESALIAEALAKGQALEPFTMCAVFSSRILASVGGRPAAESALAELIAGEKLVAVAHSEARSRGDATQVATTARKVASGWSLTGVKTLVVGGDVADRIIVSAREEGREGVDALNLFLVAAGGAGLRTAGDRLVDWTSGVDLILDARLVDEDARLASGPKALEVLQSAIDETVVVLAAEAVGAIEGAIETTADYIRGRRQFGVPLSSFQALQHRMADMAVELVQARSAVYCALEALATTNSEERSARASGCKALVTRIGKWATSQGIQLHGGYGMTEEYRVGQYYKRLLVIDALLGRREFHLDRYARWMRTQLDAA